MARKIQLETRFLLLTSHRGQEGFDLTPKVKCERKLSSFRVRGHTVRRDAVAVSPRAALLTLQV